MAVYVDPLRNWGGSKELRWKHSCHMYADSTPELHAFAEKIGLKRKWFQNDPRLPHYDLRKMRREQAVAEGAIEHTRQEMVRHLLDNRILNGLLSGKPAMATNGSPMMHAPPLTLDEIRRLVDLETVISPRERIRHEEVMQVVLFSASYRQSLPIDPRHIFYWGSPYGVDDIQPKEETHEQA